MFANWIHVSLVHLIVLGTPWLAYRVVQYRQASLNSKQWKNTYSGLILMTALTAVAYFTGPETSEWTKQVLTTFPQDHVEEHALWGRVVFVVQVIAGLIGVMGWASILQEELPDRRIPYVLMVLLLLNTLIVVYTAHLGGLIRRMDLF